MRRLLIATLCLLAPTVAFAQGISQLNPWVSTSSPIAGITQASFGRALIISGISTGNCLTLNSNRQLTTTSCGSGGGGVWPFTTGLQNFGVNVQATTTPAWFKAPVSGNISLMASSTAVFDTASSTYSSVLNTLYVGSTTNDYWTRAADHTELNVQHNNSYLDAWLQDNGTVFSLKDGGTGARMIFAPGSPTTIFQLSANGSQFAQFNPTSLTSNQNYILPDQSGTLCIVGVLCDGSGGSGAWPFTPSTYGGVANQSTTTPFWLKNTMVIASSTYFTQASTTQFTNTGTTWLTGLTGPAPIAIDATGKLYTAATTTGANPTASVGATSATNGTALTYMRSDGAPACTTATGSVPGCLSASDWTTFNGKLNLSNLWNISTNYGTSTRATTTAEWFQQGMQASSTSYFVNATTSQLTVTGNEYHPGLTSSRLLALDNNGIVIASSTLGANQLPGSGQYTVTANTPLTGGGTATLGGSVSLSIQQGSGTQNGYLSTTDWTNFNNKIGTSSAVTLGNLAYWTGNNTLGTVATTSATCSGTVSCSAFTVIGSSPITISGSGGAGAWPFTTSDTNFGVAVQSTTTPEWFQNGLMASSTSYFVNASTTQLTVSGTSLFTTGIGVNTLNTNPTADPFQATYTDNAAHSIQLYDSNAGNVAFTVVRAAAGSSATNNAMEMRAVPSGALGANPLVVPLTGVLDTGSSMTGGMTFTNQAAAGAPFLFYTNNSNERLRISSLGLVGISTSTPFWTLTVASSTGPQLALTDTTAGANAWTLRSINNSLYIATSTALATSTSAAFSINPNGVPTFPSLGNLNCVGTDATGKFQLGTCSPGSGVWSFTTTDSNFGVSVQSTTTPEWFKTPASGIFSLMASSTAWLQYASTTAISATTICLTGDTCRTTWPVGGSGGSAWPFTTGLFNYGVSVQATTTPEWFQAGLFASSTSAYPALAVSQSSTGPVAIFNGGNVGIGTSTPWGLLSLVSSTNPQFVIATSTAASPIFMVSATTTGVKDWSRITIGANALASGPNLWPLFVQGSIYSSKRTIKCEDIIDMEALTSDTSRVCDGVFTFDEDSGAATGGAVSNGIRYQSGTPSVQLWAGLTAAATAVEAAGDGAQIVIGRNSQATGWTSASSSPVFETYIAATSTNASSTIIMAGFSNNGQGSDTSVLPASGYYFVATSTTPNGDWMACAQELSDTLSCADTGIASSSARSALETFQKLAIFVTLNGDLSTDARYYINDSLVADITRPKVALSFKTALGPFVSIAKTASGNATFLWVSYIRAWADLIPGQ